MTNHNRKVAAMTKGIRQGDVLLIPCKAIPTRAVAVEPQNGRLIVAYGEATGHHHSFPHRRGAVLFRDDASGGRLYVKVTDVVALEHQEHTALTIPVGKYEVHIQRTYRAGMVRRVED